MPESDGEAINQNTRDVVALQTFEESEESEIDNLTGEDCPVFNIVDKFKSNPANEPNQLEVEVASNVRFDQSETEALDKLDWTENYRFQGESGTEVLSGQLVMDNVELHQSQDMDSEAASSPCKYRWTRTWEIRSATIGFYPSYSSNVPVLLSWNEKDKAYFSNELRVPCGDYRGHLVLEGKECPVEDFSIRSYTFEVDLFTKEDLIADDMPGSQFEQNAPKPEHGNDSSLVQTRTDFDTLENSEPCTMSSSDFRILGSKVPANTEELGAYKMTENDSLINDVQSDGENNLLSSSIKSNKDISLTNMKRDSPIGNDDDDKFSEFNLRYSNSSDNFEKSHTSPKLLKQSSDSFMKSLSQVLDHAETEMEVVEDVVRPSSNALSRTNSGSEMKREAKESLRGSRPPSIGADFVLESHQASLKHSQSVDSLYCRSQSKDADRYSADSLKNADPVRDDPSKHKRNIEQVPEMSRSSASPSYMPQHTPSKERSSQAYGSVPSSPRASAHRDLLGDNNYSRKGKVSENGETVSADNSLIARPPSHPGSRSGSLYPSRAQSLNSMISDQELTQLFEHSRPNSSGSQPRGTSSVDSLIAKGDERPTIVPNWASQPQNQSSAGDFPHYKSYPSNEMELMRDSHSRSSSISRVSAHSGSRTVTPVPGDHGTKEMSGEQVKELEAHVTSLRKLLASREAEVHSLTSQLGDLKDINRSLREELDHRGRRHTPVSNSQETFEFKQLQSEKEILASEVVTLRDEVQRLTKRHAADRGRSKAGSEITDYSPNSTAVLQRKIADLEAHIRDLQEVNEGTNNSLIQAEKKMKLLQHENKDLKARAHNQIDVQNQGDHDYRVELRTLREDIRSLKERNYQLTEDNMRLQEGQRSSSRDTSYQSSTAGSRPGSFRSDNGDARKSSGYTTAPSSRYEAAPVAALEAPDRSRAGSGSHSMPKKGIHEDLTPREIRQPVLSLNQKAVDSRCLQYQNNNDSYLHHYQQRNGSAGPKSVESPKRDFSDRSTPDGEVGDKLHLDKYAKLLSSYEKRSYDYKAGDAGSYSEKHFSYKPRLPRDLLDGWPREKSDVRDNGDNYRHLKEGQPDSNPKLSSHDRLPLSTSAISSRDIFYNVQQRRADHWSQQDKRSGNLPSLSDDHDSDSTLVLMTGNPTGKDSSLCQMSSKVKEDKHRDIATAGLGLSQNQAYSLDNKYNSGSLDYQRYQSARTAYSSPGDDSDTATDILIGQNISTKGLVHKRKTSLGSDGSPSSLSDVEDSTDVLLRRRSKSTDTKTGQSRQMLTYSRSDSASRSLASNDQTRSAGFRSVLPAPLATQHNKAEISSKSLTSLLNSSLTQGLRPFAPRSPADIRPEDVVKFSRLGGKLSQGVVKFVGRLPGRSEAYLGVELDKDEGKHDGTFEGVRYFKCKANKGVFVAFNKVVMAWAP